MKPQKAILLTVAVCALIIGCEKKSPTPKPQSADTEFSVVSEDIQNGIEKYIEEQIRIGQGYFNIAFEDKLLKLKLVRVHTEYLANLGGGRYFACVDMADISGDVYDVDFFMAGSKNAMTITETTVHKINGQPFYLWNQKRNGTWHRIAVSQATDKQLGIIKGSDTFEFIYRAKLPEIAETAKIWIPLPQSDTFQTVKINSIKAPANRKILYDRQHGNRVLFVELEPEDSRTNIEIRFDVSRLEKSVYPDSTVEQSEYLKPEQLVPDNEIFRSIASQITENKKTDLVRARAIYDHIIDRMRYMKFGSGWGKGDAVYACDARTGNCTDFHSYFIALTRSVGIPARFAIGAAIPSERNSGGVDGYHCWAEFYADGKWWPVDISEADKYTALATYYFGHNPANRFEFSKGRDLVVEPGPRAGPINFLAYPVLEIDGEPAKTSVRFFFKRNRPGKS